MDHSGELDRLRRIAILSVALLFVLGVGLVAVSLYRSAESVDWNKVTYDFGLGALIATGVATVVTMFLSRVEAREAAYITEQREQEAARRDATREQVDRMRREYEAHWTNIEKDLEQLGRDMDKTLLGFKIDNGFRQTQYLIVDTVEPILQQLYEFRTNVDPKFEHPDKPVVDAIMERLRALIENEQLAAGEPDVSPPVVSAEQPVD